MSRSAGRPAWQRLALWRHPAALLALLGSACPGVQAQSAAAGSLPAATPAWQVEAGAGAEHLSGGAAGWRQADLTLRHRYAPRSLVELSVRGARRGEVSDREFAALLTLPLGAWQGTVSGSASPVHAFLPRHAARVELARAFEGGWVASASLARRRFEVGALDSGSTQLGLGLERYLGAWRGAVVVGSTRLDGGGSAGHLRLQLDRSFADERGRIGLIVARGRELEALPATLLARSDLVEQRVDTLALVATLPLADRWALTGAASHVRNSDLRRRSGLPAGSAVERSGVRVGVRLDF